MTQQHVAPAVRLDLKPTLRLTPGGYLLDGATADTYTLNPTGRCVVDALLDGCEPGQLWSRLVPAFAVTEQRARRDVRAFLRQLRHLRLLEDARPR